MGVGEGSSKSVSVGGGREIQNPRPYHQHNEKLPRRRNQVPRQSHPRQGRLRSCCSIPSPSLPRVFTGLEAWHHAIRLLSRLLRQQRRPTCIYLPKRCSGRAHHRNDVRDMLPPPQEGIVQGRAGVPAKPGMGPVQETARSGHPNQIRPPETPF